MDRVNGRIVVSVVIIMAAGMYRIFVIKPGPVQGRTLTLTRVLVGGYILAILASIIDLVGGPVSTLTGLLLALAVMTTLFTVLPDLLSRIGVLQQPFQGAPPTNNKKQ